MVDPDEKDKAGLPLTCRAVSGCSLLNFQHWLLDSLDWLLCIICNFTCLMVGGKCLYSAARHYLSPLQVFIIAPDKRLKLSLLYPASTGRNFE